jgi:hypothetical protein
MRLVLVILYLLFYISCAQITVLHGGPKDTQAPRIKKASIEHKTTNFKGNILSFIFDEYIEVDKSKIKIFPFISQSHIIPKINGKRLNITFLNNSLLPNSTYSLELHEAVKDFREGNSMKKNTLVFSTGNNIDSNKIQIKPKLPTYPLNQKDILNNLFYIIKEQNDSNKGYQIAAQEINHSIEYLSGSKSYLIYGFVDVNQDKIFNDFDLYSDQKTIIPKSDSQDLPLYFLPRSDVKENLKNLSWINPFTFKIPKQNIYQIQVDQFAQTDLGSFFYFTSDSLIKDSIKIVINYDKVTIPPTIFQKISKIKLLPIERFNSFKDTLIINVDAIIENVDFQKVIIKHLSDTLAINGTWNENKISIPISKDSGFIELIFKDSAILAHQVFNQKFNISATILKDNEQAKNVEIINKLLNDIVVKIPINHIEKTISIPSKKSMTVNLLKGKNSLSYFEDTNKNKLWDFDRQNYPENSEKFTIFDLEINHSNQIIEIK